MIVTPYPTPLREFPPAQVEENGGHFRATTFVACLAWPLGKENTLLRKSNVKNLNYMQM